MIQFDKHVVWKHFFGTIDFLLVGTKHDILIDHSMNSLMYDPRSLYNKMIKLSNSFIKDFDTPHGKTLKQFYKVASLLETLISNALLL